MPTTPTDLDFDSLVTPLAWVGRDGRVEAGNLAFARWLQVSPKRVQGVPLAAFEFEGRVLDGLLARDGDDAPLRLRHLPLAFPGHLEPRFADLWLVPREAGGWLLEAHPVDEFPGDDPAQALPSAFSAALRGLAHELRNPLAGLKGAAQLLARRHRDDTESAGLTALLEAEVERLTGLLDRLLSPQPSRPPAPLNIHEVLERVLHLVESEAGWTVKLVRDYDPSLPDVDGDADRLTQATLNLVRNAMQAGAATVQLRSRAEHGVRIAEVLHPMVLRLEIVDDGRGVPEDLTDRLFLPLVSGRAEGSGLGLALAQQVAREHQGSLTYRSRAGHTVFTMLLPLRHDTLPNGREDGDAG
jgi:two-component system nitrogen regulation sensor histidine kinase GlnL